MSKSIRSISLGVIILLTVMFSSLAYALEPVDKWEGTIDYAATGASLLDDTIVCTIVDMQDGNDPIPVCITPDSPGSNCGDAENLLTGSVENICFNTVIPAVSYQGDTVLTESEAFLGGIPANINILKAYLVWIGTRKMEGTADNEIYLTPPGGYDYKVTAVPTTKKYVTEAWYGNHNYEQYSYRVDVTEIMRTHHISEGLPLDGFYKVSGYDGFCGEYIRGNTTCLGGWSLMFVYSDPLGVPKRLYYYEDFARVQDSELVQTPSGFEVPSEPEAKVTFFIAEGDHAIVGYGASGLYNEGIYFNDTILTDSCNTDDNAYNSTINTNLNPSEGECRYNQYSIDLDTFDVSDLLSEGDTSAKVTLSLGTDIAISNYIVLSIKSKLPNFDIPNEPEKAASVEDGEGILPGEDFTYYIYVQNNGEDVATNVLVKDNLPSSVHYIPNSTYLVSPNGTRTLIEDPTGGTPPCFSGIKVADEIPADATQRYTIEIGVTLKTLEEGITKDTIIENTAEIISGDGDVYFTNGGIPTRHGVKMESYEGKLNFTKGSKHAESHFVSPGETGVNLAHMNMTATDGNVNLVSMSFTPVTDTDATMISLVKLYLDSGNDGVVSPTDTLIGEAQWNSNSLTFNDFSSLGEIAKDSTVSLVLMADISGNISGGSVGQVELLESGVTVRGFTNGLPFKSSKLLTPADDTNLSVEFGENNPPDSYITPGEQIVTAQFLFKSYSDGNAITGLTLGVEGTVYEPSEVEEIKLYSDLDQNGKVSSGDEQLGETIVPTSDNQSLEFSNFNIALNSGEKAYVIVDVMFADEIGNDKYFMLTLSSEIQIDAGSANILGTPLTGSSFTISESTEGCETDLECQSQFGFSWYCDSVNGLCKDGGSSTDGDGGITDGDTVVDGDTGGNPEQGGGGCFTTDGSNYSALIFLSLFAILAIVRRRRIN